MYVVIGFSPLRGKRSLSYGVASDGHRCYETQVFAKRWAPHKKDVFINLSLLCVWMIHVGFSSRWLGAVYALHTLLVMLPNFNNRLCLRAVTNRGQPIH